MILDSLPSYLQTSTVTPVSSRIPERAAQRTSAWQGRQVEIAPLLSNHLGEGETVSGAELQQPMALKYGEYIQDYFRYDIIDKTLDRRAVSKLEARASKMLRDIRKLNRESIDIWLQGSMAERAFQKTSSFTWRSLPDYEKENLKEDIQRVLGQYKGYLSYSLAEKLAAECASQYQSHFTLSAPNTATFLAAESVDDEVILSGHLALWAQQHFNRAAEPGTPVDSGDGMFEAGVNITEFDKKLLCNAEACTRMTNRLLLDSALEKLQVESFEDQLAYARHVGERLIKNLNVLWKVSANVPDELKEAVKTDLINQLHDVVAHIHELEDMAYSDPLNEESWQSFKEVELTSAIKVLEREVTQLKSVKKPDLPRIEALDMLRQEWVDQLEDVLEGTDNNFPPLAGGMSQRQAPISDAKTYTKVIVDQLKEAGFGKKAGKRLGHARHLVLSTANWNTVTTDISAQIGGKPLHYTSSLIPASQMKLDPEGLDIFPVDYDGTGRPSTATQETQHAVNLGQTVLTTPKSGGEALVFKGLRSGTLSAYGIKNDKATREKANENRARELVTAALKQFLDDHPQYNQPGVEVPLRLFSTSLLSADKARHFTHVHDDELKMQREQEAALKAIQEELKAGKPLQIKQPDGSLKSYAVKLQLATTNYGVNNISLSGLQALMRPWGEAKKINNEGLQDLLGSLDMFGEVGGWAGEYLASASESDQDKAIVRQLVEQIRDLHVSGDYRREGDDAYKMVERLQYLAFKLGAVTHINCKSGKDRTGEADAAIKRFAAEVEALGYVPELRKPLTREDRKLAQTFLVETGNIKWQQMNINRPGYKTRVGKKQVGAYVYDMSHRSQFHVK